MLGINQLFQFLLLLFLSVFLGDFFSFNPINRTWTSRIVSLVSQRAGMGLAATPDGLIYLFGGGNGIGEKSEASLEHLHTVFTAIYVH
jgi:hypothetical protein